VTTCDSRIRYIDLNSSKQIFKYKGHKTKNFNIRASISDDLELIMSASEDGRIYVWQNMQLDDLNYSPRTRSKIKDRSSLYETFCA